MPEPVVWLLIVYLVGGGKAYDDNLTSEQCHFAAEALKEGGIIEVDGLGLVPVKTAFCVDSPERRLG